MIVDYRYLLFVLVACIIVLLLIRFIKLFKPKVTVSFGTKKRKMTEKAFVYFPEKGKDTRLPAELRLDSAPNEPAIGQVLVKDDKGWVSIQKNRNNAISEDIEYWKCGYVDENGYIYSYFGKGRGPVRVGYLARPNEPNKPTLKGKRKWTSLWLRSELNAYYGEPEVELTSNVTESTNAETNSETKEEEVAPVTNQAILETESPIVEETQDMVEDLEVNQAIPETVSPSVEEVQNTKDESETIFVVDESIAEPVVSDAQIPETRIIEEPKEKKESRGPLNAKVPDADIKADEIVPSETDGISTSETVGVETETQEQTVSDEVPEDEVECVEQAVSEGEPEDESQVQIASNEESENDHQTIQEQECTAEDEEKENALLQKILNEQKDIINEILANMVKVDGGSFNMGADPELNKKPNYKIEDNEHPIHKVNLDNYFIGKFPVTQREWTAIMGYNNSAKKGDDYPVAPVTWYECDLFVKRLSKLTGLEFSLPTEAQWEYAARGGRKANDTIYAGSNYFNEVGWQHYYAPVGKKQPNELGIYDMSGLVREWCSDWYALYEDVEQFNPKGSEMPEKPEDRRKVVRSIYGNETVTNRKSEEPETNEFKSYGFRIACNNVPNEKERALGKHEPPVLVGECTKFGIGRNRSKDCIITDEGRAGAFSVLYYLNGKKSYEEYQAETPYKWADTALLSSVIYVILYLLVYVVNSGILQYPMYDNDSPLLSQAALTGYYFVLWAIVRWIKIDCAENGHSFQPILDLFNKAIGIIFADILILLICVLCYFDIDFIPMIWAILLGTFINLVFNRNSKIKWEVKNPLVVDKDETEDEIDEETGDYLPPRGEERRDYKWNLKSFNDKKLQGELVLKFNIKDIEIQRLRNPFFSEKPNLTVDETLSFVDIMINKMMTDRSLISHVRYLAQYIRKMSERFNLSEMDKLQFALDFVQCEDSIRFVEDMQSSVIDKPFDYVRYPDELLYDKEGDCDCKSLLMLILIHELGYDAKYLISDELEHTAVAVAMKTNEWEKWVPAERREDIVIESNGKPYVFCETSNYSYKIGMVAPDHSVTKFDLKRDLICESDKEDEE